MDNSTQVYTLCEIEYDLVLAADGQSRSAPLREFHTMDSSCDSHSGFFRLRTSRLTDSVARISLGAHGPRCSIASVSQSPG